MPQKTNRTERLEARIAPDTLLIVKRAAELQGRSVSDFVVVAAQEAAHRAIGETHLIHLSAAAQTRFAELLADPPEENEALQRAHEAHQRLVTASP